MGNYASSCLVTRSGSTKTAKLVDSEGNLRQVKLPLKAGELMLEEPGHVICPVEELRRTGRVTALKAEDELSSRKFYLLVPLCRVHCRVSETEMRIVELANTAACKKMKKRTSSSKKKRGGSAKVLPAVGVVLKEEEREIVSKHGLDVLGGQDVGFAGYRSPQHNRMWSPVLEPISEEEL